MDLQRHTIGIGTDAAIDWEREGLMLEITEEKRRHEAGNSKPADPEFEEGKVPSSTDEVIRLLNGRTEAVSSSNGVLSRIKKVFAEISQVLPFLR